MTRIQQVLWEVQMDYSGHPYYVSGNALHHALRPHLQSDTHAALAVSHGIFVPGQFGRYPDTHSQSDVRPHLGSGLPDVEADEDLFLQRHPDHGWLLDSRPRDALNVHDLRKHGGHPVLAHETIMDRRAEQHRDRQTTNWYIHAYIRADTDDVLPLDDTVLDGLQFGGKRNYGYGTVSLKDTQLSDLDDLDYSRIETGDAFVIKLVTPFVLESASPNTNAVSVPWWWAETDAELRCREEVLFNQREPIRLQTIDHGQVVTYCGDRPVETAKNGLQRVGTHSRFGFGELHIKPVPPADTPAENVVD